MIVGALVSSPPAGGKPAASAIVVVSNVGASESQKRRTAHMEAEKTRDPTVEFEAALVSKVMNRERLAL